MITAKFNKMRQMNKIYIAVFLVLLFSCTPTQNKQVVSIDLSQEIKDIYYSELADSLSYLTLNTNDTCIMSGIKKLYFDKDTIIAEDNRRGGVCTFTKDGNFIKQINCIGEGPTELTHISSIAVDTILHQICIYDIMRFQINKYTYQGEFIESYKIKDVIRDFAVVHGENIMIMPCYNPILKSGVWSYNPMNETSKHLINDVPSDLEFEFISTFYNQTPTGLYYYDRNYDNLYFISIDSATLLYDIDLKQSIPFKTRKSSGPSPAALADRAMMFDFCVSSNYIMFIYFTFEEKDNPFKWVCMNRADHSISVAKSFTNDIDKIQSSENQLFHVNDSTWCRVLDPLENDCDITLQLIHLKR